MIGARCTGLLRLCIWVDDFVEEVPGQLNAVQQATVVAAAIAEMLCLSVCTLLMQLPCLYLCITQNGHISNNVHLHLVDNRQLQCLLSKRVRCASRICMRSSCIRTVAL